MDMYLLAFSVLDSKENEVLEFLLFAAFYAALRAPHLYQNEKWL